MEKKVKVPALGLFMLGGTTWKTVKTPCLTVRKHHGGGDPEQIPPMSRHDNAVTSRGLFCVTCDEEMPNREQRQREAEREGYSQTQCLDGHSGPRQVPLFLALLSALPIHRPSLPFSPLNVK